MRYLRANRLSRHEMGWWVLPGQIIGKVNSNSNCGKSIVLNLFWWSGSIGPGTALSRGRGFLVVVLMWTPFCSYPAMTEGPRRQ